MATTVTSSASRTLVSMFNAVGTAAQTVTQTVHTTASALDMLDQYVKDARVEQIARSMSRRESLLSRIHEETALEISERQDELKRKLSSNNQLFQLFETNYKSLEETMLKIGEKIAELDNRVTA